MRDIIIKYLVLGLSKLINLFYLELNLAVLYFHIINIIKKLYCFIIKIKLEILELNI